jgi:Zn-dependent protease
MRLRIGSGFGIPVYIHWTFLLLPLWILVSHPGDSEISLGLVFCLLPLVFACVVLHEFGHALTARWFGIGTRDVTLYPIGGVARLEKMTDNPLEEFVIAVAGPAVNVVIAVVLGCVLLPLAMVDHDLMFSTFAFRLALYLLSANVFMVLFNMIPAFPMDGGRVLRAFLSALLGHYQGTQIAVGIGMVVAVAVGLAGIVLLGNPMLAVIAAFVFFAGQQELMAARYRHLKRRQQWYDEEPPLVMPARNWHATPAEGPSVPAPPPLIFQPRISVYTWDNQTGTWRKDPGTA